MAAANAPPTRRRTTYVTNQRFQVKFSASSTGADTLNISARGAKALKQFSSTGAKIPAVFASGMISDVVYDGTDMVVMDPVRGLTTSLVARLSSAVVQAIVGASIAPAVFSPLSYSFTADGSLYEIFVKLNMNTESVTGTGSSNAIGAKLMNGATQLDGTSANISVPSFEGKPLLLKYSGPLAGPVSLTTTFEKTHANGSLSVNGDRDDTTSNISGQISWIEIWRIGA